MKKKLIIVGSGLQAKILAFEIMNSKKVNLVGFFDPKKKKSTKITIKKNKSQFIQK